MFKKIHRYNSLSINFDIHISFDAYEGFDTCSETINYRFVLQKTAKEILFFQREFFGICNIL